MTAPFHPEFNAGYDDQFFTFRRNDNAQMLSFIRKSFYSPFGIRFSIRLTFPIIDGSIIQYFMDFLLGDMPAIHAATGVFGEDELAARIKGLMAGNPR